MCAASAGEGEAAAGEGALASACVRVRPRGAMSGERSSARGRALLLLAGFAGYCLAIAARAQRSSLLGAAVSASAGPASARAARTRVGSSAARLAAFEVASEDPRLQRLTAHMPTSERERLLGGLERRERQARVVDTFPFNNELDLLELRLRELEGSVHRHVLVESMYTQTGKPKRLYFNETKARFQRWLPRIEHVVVSELPDMSASASAKDGKLGWKNEVYVRNQAGRGLSRLLDAGEVAADDVVVVSDCDEILSPEALFVLSAYKGYPALTKVSLRWSFYGFFWVKPGPTVVGAAASAGWFVEEGNRTHAVRDWKTAKRVATWTLGDPRESAGAAAVLAGWHCSWCTPVEEWQQKRDSVVEPPYRAKSKDKYGLEKMQELRRTGKWFAEKGRAKGVRLEEATASSGEDVAHAGAWLPNAVAGPGADQEVARRLAYLVRINE